MHVEHVERFEPVYLEFDGPLRMTEYGKRWFTQRADDMHRFGGVLRDIFKLGIAEERTWPWVWRQLVAEGVPLAMSSGMSQYTLAAALNHFAGKTSTTMPATITLALGTAAPASTTTGAWGTTESTNYTGYARKTLTTSSDLSSATAATPSHLLNATQIQFAGCSGGGSVAELGFLMVDNATIGSGNALFWGGLTSVTISPTQTPPTIAASALDFSLNTT